MATAEQKTPSPSASKRPGRSLGQAQELTVMARLKPGGADRLRKLFAEGFTGDRQHITDRMGTVHDLRFVIFDNDTRSTLRLDVRWRLGCLHRRLRHEGSGRDRSALSRSRGLPRHSHPRIKDFIVKSQVTASAFYSAYPDATVRDIWKALKTKKALDELLDQA